MSEQESRISFLTRLENHELVGVIFVRDYIQLQFDDAILSFYTLPQISILHKDIASKDFGYCDTLCSLIGKKIISSTENSEQIIIDFEQDKRLLVSLRYEDRNCAEALTLMFENGQWNTW